MPPRRYKHTARWRYQPLRATPQPYQNSILQARGLATFDPKRIERWMVQVGRGERRVKQRIRYPILNGRNDPLTIMLVIDTLLNVEIDTYINAGALQEYLRETQPDVMWDPITLGRILAEIANITHQVWDHETLGRIMWGGVKQYVIPDTHEAWSQLGELRDYFGEVAKERMASMRVHGTIPSTFNVWELPGFHEPTEEAA